MVKASNTGEYQGTVFSAICSIGAIFCMVIAVLGIKFKWFRRRLDLQQLPEGNTRENRSKEQRSDDILSQGVFRKRLEDEILTESERSKTLPPVKVRSSDRNLKISLPHENNSEVKSASHPSRPTVPPPSDIFGTVSTGAIPRISSIQNVHENDGKIEEMSTKSTFFRKNATAVTKLPPKYDALKISMDEIDDSSQRRQTGLFFPVPEKNLENSFARNYSEGFGISEEALAKQAPDLLTSIQETSPDAIQVTTNETQHFTQPTLENKDNENDIFAKIRMPKPEPRRTIASTQSRKTLDMKECNKGDTEV